MGLNLTQEKRTLFTTEAMFVNKLHVAKVRVISKFSKKFRLVQVKCLQDLSNLYDPIDVDKRMTESTAGVHIIFIKKQKPDNFSKFL